MAPCRTASRRSACLQTLFHRKLPQFSTAPNARHAPVSKAARLPGLQSVKVVGPLRERIRCLHYSRRTEEAYVYWVRAFIRFRGLRHPNELSDHEVEQFYAAR